MSKIINIQDRLENSNRSKDKDISNKNIGPQKDKITLIPRENRILLEIIEDELIFLNGGLIELSDAKGYIEDHEKSVSIEELQDYYVLFESINEKVKNSFGLDFLPNLTLRELANLAAAVEEKSVSFEFEGCLFTKSDQDLKREIDDLYDQLMGHFIKVANCTPPDIFN